jgi:hypothetical protein
VGRRPRTAPETLERVPKNPPAQGGWNGQKVDAGTGEALTGPGAAAREETVRITAKREVASSRKGVGGGDGSDDGRDNITRSERSAPASPMQVFEGRGW